VEALEAEDTVDDLVVVVVAVVVVLAVEEDVSGCKMTTN